MNYVSIDILTYVAAIVETMRNAPEEAYARFTCQYQSRPVSGNIDCWRQPEYLVPDSTRVSGRGDIERMPMFFCREHTAEIVGEELEEQPMFGRIVNPGELDVSRGRDTLELRPFSIGEAVRTIIRRSPTSGTCERESSRSWHLIC